MPIVQPQLSGTPLLQMRGVEKSFGATRALDGVDLVLYPGEVLALVGENGAGKSTLMKALSGAHAPDSGEMLLEGQAYRPTGPIAARKAGVAMIYQELSLAPDLTVAENLFLGMEPKKGLFLNRKELRDRTKAALIEVGYPDLDPDTIVGELPVAVRQLVEIARAVAIGCKVLVLDEPTSSLAAKDIERLFRLVERLREDGKGIIYISHYLEEIRALSSRFTVLRDGKSVGGGLTAKATDAEIISLMVGREVEMLDRKPRPHSGEIVLRIDNLAGAKKPENATLELHRGEVIGIAGIVGAGRTELLRTLFGLDKVKSGDIRIATAHGSASDHGAKPARRWNEGVGMVSEDRKGEGLALELSIAENLTLPGLPRIVSPKKVQAEANEWADKLAVKRRTVAQPIGDLSGGNQQKVALARLLHHDADILLLDEPTRGIDIGAKALIYETIAELAEAGKSFIVVSSYLPELFLICDRIAVMRKGVLGEAKPVDQIDSRSIMSEAVGADSPLTAPAGGAA